MTVATNLNAEHPQWMHDFAALCERRAADWRRRHTAAAPAPQPAPRPTRADLQARLAAATRAYCAADEYADDYTLWAQWSRQRQTIAALRAQLAALEGEP